MKIFLLYLNYSELSFGHSYEHCKTKHVVDSTLFPNIAIEVHFKIKNVVDSTLFPKIVIEKQCIDFENWSFLNAKIVQNMKFSSMPIDLFRTVTWASSYEHFMTKKAIL